MPSNKDELTRSKQLETEQEVREANTLLHEDVTFQYGFTQLPNQVLYARNLSLQAKMLYAILLSYSWKEDRCFPGYTSLCKHLQLGRDMVRKYMKELEEVKLLQQKRRGLGKTNVYTLLSLKNANLLPDDDSIRHQEVDKSRHQNDGQTRQKEYTSNNTQNKEYSDISKGQRPKTQKKGRGDDQVTTYSHIAGGAIRSEENRKAKIEPDRKRRETPQSISQIMQGRVANFQIEAPISPPPTVTQPPSRLKGNWKKAPLFIQAMISEWFSPELHDQAITSSITRTNKLYQAFVKAAQEKYPEQVTLEQLEDIFRDCMVTARAKAKRANIKTLTEKGWPNRMPYFFACLEKVLALPSSETQ